MNPLRPLLLTALLGPAALPPGVPIRLPNGLQARLVEDHEAPLIRLQGLVPIAPEDVPTHLPGLPTLLLAVLSQGPKGSHSAAAFQMQADASAVKVDLHAEGRGWRFSLTCRSRDQELAFGLLGDLLSRGSLDPTLLEAQRMQLFREQRDPSQAARTRWVAEASGSALMPPPEATLSKATLQDLEALKARVLRPERLRVELQGDLSPAQAQQLLLLNLGAWQPAPAPVLPRGPEPATVTQWAQPEAPGLLWAALPPLREGEAEAPLLELLLPEHLEGLQGHGRVGDPWRLRVAASTPQEALRILEGRLGNVAFTEAEVVAARATWRGRRALEALSPAQALESRLARAPEAEGLDRVTAADLNRRLRDLTSREARRLLWTGDPAWLRQLTRP